MLGANQLKDTLVNCLNARGISPIAAVVLPQQLSNRADAETRAALMHTGTTRDMMAINKRIECDIGIDFDITKNTPGEINSALNEIVAASRVMQAHMSRAGKA